MTFVPPKHASDPSRPRDGCIYYNETSSNLKVFDSRHSTWNSIATDKDFSTVMNILEVLDRKIDNILHQFEYNPVIGTEYLRTKDEFKTRLGPDISQSK